MEIISWNSCRNYFTRMDCLDWFKNKYLVVERTKKSIEGICYVEREVLIRNLTSS